jgi:carboxyl-terminal processing protease
LTRDWTPDAATMEDFKQFAMKRGMTIDQADWDRDKPWLEEYVREQLFITAFSKEDSDRLALDHDPEIQKAIEALPQSKALLEKAKAIIARQSHEPAAAIVR